MAAQLNDPLGAVRRELEQIFGYPRGAFDPASTILRDMERINRALGGLFPRIEYLIDPQQLVKRIEATFESPAAREVLDLPKKIWELLPPPTDRKSGR